MGYANSAMGLILVIFEFSYLFELGSKAQGVQVQVLLKISVSLISTRNRY